MSLSLPLSDDDTLVLRGVGWLLYLLGLAYIVGMGWNGYIHDTVTVHDVLLGCVLGGAVAIVGLWAAVVARRLQQGEGERY